MANSEPALLATLAYWTTYAVLQEGAPLHPGEDWATKNLENSLDHGLRHMQNYEAHWQYEHHDNGNITPKDRDYQETELRHALCRATMLYWAWLRDNNRLTSRLTLPEDFLKYLKKELTQ